MCVCVCVWGGGGGRACMCVCVCVCACVHACVRRPHDRTELNCITCNRSCFQLESCLLFSITMPTLWKQSLSITLNHFVAQSIFHVLYQHLSYTRPSRHVQQTPEGGNRSANNCLRINSPCNTSSTCASVRSPLEYLAQSIIFRLAPSVM